jgi:exopolysaccharide biosynthesis polyprenyl glycosylphosphotransferase
VGHALRNHLEALRHMGFRFKGFIALDVQDTETGSVDVVGNLSNCLDVARSLFVDEIYFSTPTDKNAIMALVVEARAAGVDVRVVPDLFEGLAWNAPVEYIGQFPTIPLHQREFPRGAFLTKRVMDVALSLLAIVVLFPFMLLIAAMVKLDSPGPVLYSSERIGRKGRIFRCYKFRTMVKDADDLRDDLMGRNERDGILFKINKDPRITKLGISLRKYSLDEIPQFFNVLMGNMSLVGPRPPLAGEVEQYELSHLKRLNVLPGMTGLWQVEARQDPSFDSYISLDTAYVENWNLMLDLRILARTVGVVLDGTGS